MVHFQNTIEFFASSVHPEVLHGRRDTQLTKSDSDPKLGEGALEGRITANTDPNKSKTTTKNDLLVLKGQQQNTVFHKDNPRHKQMTKKNQRAGRNLPKSQVSHQHNTAAEILANPHKNTFATTER